ncbi:MAG: hypothetical protein EA358_04890 [Flavobacteriales bacterium]|jgi:hypothetical protein|nr:MAG: hypothetical protein EA358_04890 [Flavobacteriales bacterium]
MEKFGNFGIILTYIMIGISVAIIVGFALIKVVTDFQKSKNSIIGLVIMLVIFLIAYATSSGADYVNYKADMGITESTSRMVGAGLVTFFIIGAAAVIAIIYAELSKALK